jgi:NADP-dependent 3-hydroxy acid dehydrogenase YdfG
MQKIVFITGATSGIGKACANVFAKAGYAIIITGRRVDRLQKLKLELEESFSVKCLAIAFDVQNKEAVNQAIENIPEEWKAIQILINNAGLAVGRDNFEQAQMDDWEVMINTNIKGLLYVSKALLPLLIANKDAHIINIGSTAAKEVYLNGNVYCATKAAVDSISKAQRIDLLNHGIKVTVIHPGAVETEFSIVRFKGDTSKANAVYEGYKALSALDVADVIFYTASLPKHVCINEMVLTCTAQANSFYIHK